MSGILGVWNLDGAPVSREILAAMSKRLAHRGPDGESIWTNSELGMVVQMMRSTPESLTEIQPLTHSSGAVLVFDGRLDNRADLLRELTPFAGLTPAAPDTVFVQAAYLQRGPGFLKLLNGEFALTLWDPRARVLVLGRDAMGSRPLYYTRAGDRFLFASEIKALLAHPAIKTRPNDLALAEYFYRAYDYMDESKTFFANIHTVPPGNSLEVTDGGMNLSRFWDFDTCRQLRFKTEEEYVEAYREHFFAAVRRRLRSASPVSIMASGGLDSSSIFCTAMTLKAASPSDIPELFGVSGVAQFPDTNEMKYQREIERLYGVELLKVPLAQTETAPDAAKYIYAAEAPFAQWKDLRRYWEVSRDHGARIVLSGFFGDQVLASPVFMLDLLLHFRWATLRESFQGYCDYHAWTPRSEHFRNLVHLLKYYAIPEWLRPVYRGIKRRLTRPDTELTWYSERFAALGERLRMQSGPPEGKGGTAHARGLYHMARSIVHVQRTTMDSLWESHLRLQTSYPFRDRELLAFLMAIPGAKVFPNGIPRGLHREAMRGILPEAIRTRKDKADFTVIGQQGALKDLLQVEKTLPASIAARFGYLRPPDELRRELAKVRAELEGNAPASASWNLQDLVFLDVWLSVFFPES